MKIDTIVWVALFITGFLIAGVVFGDYLSPFTRTIMGVCALLLIAQILAVVHDDRN